eukprot:TRINITY_DN2248_c0_g3_i2.p1 TRINITY_DN2248_c0_g3~~TRINITY_DN2248_c0_g3_i2.p1  ORF type:complete len:1660 (+),score=520.72 TRINITY_DN2248_c0_g3_i2:66-5045(+)
MASVLVSLAKGVLWIFRILLAMVMTLFWLASFFAPWRWYWNVKAANKASAESLEAWDAFCCYSFWIAIWETLTLAVFLVDVCTWRSYFLLGTLCHEDIFDHTDNDIGLNTKLYETVWFNFGCIFRDIFFSILVVLNTVMFWGAPRFWSNFMGGWKDDVRARKRCEQILKDFGESAMEIYLMPMALIILLTCYRAAPCWRDVKGQNKSVRRNKVTEHFCLLLADFGCLILLIIECALIIRIPAIVRDFRTAGDAWDRRHAVLRNFPKAFRELLAFAVYLLLLPSVYRFYLALASALQQCGDEADPTPHTQLTSVAPTFPEGGGLHLAIKGHKPKDLAVQHAKLYLRDASYWDKVGSVMGSTVATVGKSFLPIDLTAKKSHVVMDTAAFTLGATSFDAALVLKGKTKKSTIVKKLGELGGGTFLQIVIEFGADHDGTLMVLECTHDELLAAAEAGGSIPLPGRHSWTRDLTKASSAEMVKGGTKKKGALFCDVMAVPALIQLGYLLVDIVALCLFLLLHLIPWRVFSLYQSILGHRDIPKHRDSIRALRKAVSVMKDRRRAVDSFRSAIDIAVKNGKSAIPDTEALHSANATFWYFYYDNVYGDDRAAEHGVQRGSAFMTALGVCRRKLEKCDCADGAALLTKAMTDVLLETRLAGKYAAEVARHAGTLLPGASEESAGTLWQKLKTVYQQGASNQNRTVLSAFPWLRVLYDSHDLPSPAETEEGSSWAVIPGQYGALPQPSEYAAYIAKCEHQAAEKSDEAVHDEIVGPLSKLKEESQAFIKNAKCVGCKGVSWGRVRKSVFRATFDLFQDFAALLCVLLVIGLVYRIPVLIRTMYRNDPYNRHRVAFNNLKEIGVDFLYLLKALCVIVALRHALPFLGNLMDFTLRFKSFNVARYVTDYYFKAVMQDIVSMLTFAFSIRAIKWGVGAAAVGVITPGATLAHLVTDNPVCSGLIIFLISLWFYAWPCVAATQLFPGGDDLTGFAVMFVPVAVVAVGYWVYLVAKDRAGQVKPIADVRFTRWNWFNGMQYVCAVLEPLQLLALYAVHVGTGVLQDIANAVLLRDVRPLGSYSFGTWVALGLVCVYYILVALPVVVMALNSTKRVYESSAWVFLYILLSSGFSLFIVHGLMFFVVCEDGVVLDNATDPDSQREARVMPLDSTVPCWEGSHLTLAIPVLLFLLFYILTTLMKIPEYTTRECGYLDLFFAESYECFLKLGQYGAVIAAVLLRHSPDGVLAAVLAGALWPILGTLALNCCLSIGPVCSVETFSVWRTMWYAVAVSGAVALKVWDSEGEAMAGWAVFGACVGLAVAVSACRVYRLITVVRDGLEITPEQIQDELLGIQMKLQLNGLLLSGMPKSRWRGYVRNNIRVSRLTLALMKLEHYVRLDCLDALFLTTRCEWYKSNRTMVDPDDERDELIDKDVHWNSDSDGWFFHGDGYDADFCECICPCCLPDNNINERPSKAINENQLGLLAENVKKLGNAIRIAPKDAPPPEPPAPPRDDYEEPAPAEPAEASKITAAAAALGGIAKKFGATFWGSGTSGAAAEPECSDPADATKMRALPTESPAPKAVQYAPSGSAGFSNPGGAQTAADLLRQYDTMAGREPAPAENEMSDREGPTTPTSPGAGGPSPPQEPPNVYTPPPRALLTPPQHGLTQIEDL